MQMIQLKMYVLDITSERVFFIETKKKIQRQTSRIFHCLYPSFYLLLMFYTEN